MITKRILAIAALLALAAGGAALAEKKDKEDPNTRSVQGVVVDSGDNVVQGAVVQLKDTKTLQVRSFITQEKGEFHFAGLSTNIDYQLKAESGGASSAVKTLSVFDSRKVARMTLKLDKK
ncbi:MAG: carboxypeptidase regulatory-like domain-containing protein [Acidobacteria bacterium]|nr:carboxypeptidase regulatory-like domain-containing protein [Acidobacteriota bacterium]